MVINLRFVLMLLAVIVFVLAAFRVNASPRVDLTALGLALWALAIVVG